MQSGEIDRGQTQICESFHRVLNRENDNEERWTYEVVDTARRVFAFQEKEMREVRLGKSKDKHLKPQYRAVLGASPQTYERDQVPLPKIQIQHLIGSDGKVGSARQISTLPKEERMRPIKKG